jgi:DNA-binding FrmR family transcriptional regulator
MCFMPREIHASHPAIVKRLKRAEGHLRGVIAMIETGRPCLELAQQLHAVERAIARAKKTLVHDHLDHCLGDAAQALPLGQQRSIEEFKEITKYL